MNYVYMIISCLITLGLQGAGIKQDTPTRTSKLWKKHNHKPKKIKSKSRTAHCLNDAASSCSSNWTSEQLLAAQNSATPIETFPTESASANDGYWEREILSSLESANSRACTLAQKLKEIEDFKQQLKEERSRGVSTTTLPVVVTAAQPVTSQPYSTYAESAVAFKPFGPFHGTRDPFYQGYTHSSQIEKNR
jgi:hypothetical protein